MDIELRHQPSFAVARVTLAGGEQLKAESGAMMATSGGITVQASTEGGLMKGLKRSFLGGESLFVTTYTAPANGGWVDLANFLAGDVVRVDVQAGAPVNVTKGSWMASAGGVHLDTKWGGFKNLMGGEGGFLVRAEGEGPLLLACYGAIDRFELGAGETMVVDTGHVVAFSDTVTSQLRQVTGGMAQAFKSGEGLVFEFAGPGWVLTQSRNPSELQSWIRAIMPGQSGGASSGPGGLLGGLLGN